MVVFAKAKCLTDKVVKDGKPEKALVPIDMPFTCVLPEMELLRAGHDR